MAIYGITIENLGNSASIVPVWMVGARLTKGIKVLNQVDPIDGSNDVVEVRQGGIENPVYTIEGKIDIHNTSGTHTVNGVTGCYKVTEPLLISLSALSQTSNSYLVMKAAYGTNGTYLHGRGTGSGTYISNLTNSVFVAVDSVNIDIPSDSMNNHLWNYSITLIETKKPGTT